MKLGQRIWRTNDGRFVLDGDLDAAFLAYGSGDDVPDDIAAQFAETAAEAASSDSDSGEGDDSKKADGGEAETKQGKPPANKAKAKAADKSGS